MMPRAGLLLWGCWLVWGVLSSAAVRAQTAAVAPVLAPVPVREKPKDFLDSLSDSVLASSQTMIYRQNGNRREVDFGRGLILALDERAPQLLSGSTGRIGTSSSPGQMLGLAWDPEPGIQAGLWYEKGDADRIWRLDGRLAIDAQAWLHAGTRELRSNIDDWSGIPPTELRRRDRLLGMSWIAQDWEHRIDLRHSDLQPQQPSDLAPSVSASQWRWQVRRPVPLWPGLDAGLTIGDTLSDAVRNTGLAGSLVELRASQSFDAESWWPGARLQTRVAPATTLTGEEIALTQRAAWKRQVALELPYGGAKAGPVWADVLPELGQGGMLYTQWRDHSLADPADQLWLLGWRQAWRMPQRWGYETRIEHSRPMGGSSPLLGTQIAHQVSYSEFPHRSVSANLTLGSADAGDSAYTSLQHTERLADDWLAALRLSAARRQPHGDPAGGLSEAKVALAAGWREPAQRRLYLLGRYTQVMREIHPDFRDPNATDRRAHILLGYLGWLGPDHDTWTLRLTRRLDRDEIYGAQMPRRTSIATGRVIVEGSGRLNLSAHVAQRRDDVDGITNSYGAELGLRLSSKATLAFGYNPRGFSDSELTIDDKLAKGWTIRLRFTIEGAVGRWLDAGRSQPTAWFGRPLQPVPPPADLIDVRVDPLLH